MRDSILRIHGLVEGIRPFDALESLHRQDTLRWLERTEDVFRRAKPATPPRHLVSYVVLTDYGCDKVLLVDHRNAQLWLPPGGHVEPDEDPVQTARRELAEELGIEVTDGLFPCRPTFVTVTETVGIDHGHTDVSLWFHDPSRFDERIRFDEREFAAVRWWLTTDIVQRNSATFEPHMARFLMKLRVPTD
jgi:8-oxo-dGTP pyrophosphatase MutT (NUDIX family)